MNDKPEDEVVGSIDLLAPGAEPVELAGEVFSFGNGHEFLNNTFRMVYQYITTIIWIFCFNLVPLKAVELPEVMSHAGNVINVFGNDTTFIRNIRGNSFVVGIGVILTVKLTSPAAQFTPKMVESIQPISGSRFPVVGGIPTSGEHMSNSTADKPATNDLNNIGPNITHVVLGFVVFVVLAGLGGCVGWKISEWLSGTRLFRWLYLGVYPVSLLLAAGSSEACIGEGGANDLSSATGFGEPKMWHSERHA
jgi:hypothetical protein